MNIIAKQKNPVQNNPELPLSAARQSQLGLLEDSIRLAFLAGSPALARIELRVESCLNSKAERLNEISRYLLQLGGKRIRPLLTILAARLFRMSEESSELVDAAAGIELIHMATLLHDDIIDNSATRRGKPSALVKYGANDTLLAADFLLTKAFGLCARLDEFVIGATETACVELAEGQILEGKLDLTRQVSLEDYLDVIAKKTASLFNLSCRVGAHLAGAPTECISAMEKFGLHAGLAFQIVDDVLDVTADESLLGKPSGTDLKQKTPSIVNVLWLASGDAKALDFFNDSFDIQDGTIAELVEYLKSSPAIESSKQLARNHAELATKTLLSLPENLIDSATRDQLFAVIDYTISRCL